MQAALPPLLGSGKHVGSESMGRDVLSCGIEDEQIKREIHVSDTHAGRVKGDYSGDPGAASGWTKEPAR